MVIWECLFNTTRVRLRYRARFRVKVRGFELFCIHQGLLKEIGQCILNIRVRVRVRVRLGLGERDMTGLMIGLELGLGQAKKQ